MAAPAVPPTPPDTNDYESAVANGYYGERTDPLPDEFYMASGGASKLPPYLSACQPSEGPPEGGTTLNIGGRNLTGTAIVAVGQEPCTDVTVVDDTQVTAVTPAGQGRQHITVANVAGKATLAGQFLYVEPPVIP